MAGSLAMPGHARDLGGQIVQAPQYAGSAQQRGPLGHEVEEFDGG